MALDLLAADGLGSNLGAVTFGPERKANDRPWKSVLSFNSLEPREVQGFPYLGWDFFQRHFRPALVEEVALRVKHDHGVFGEYLRIVCDLERALNTSTRVENTNKHENRRGNPCHISRFF